MKHLIVYAHPNPNSFNKAIVDTIIETLKAREEEVELRDLYKLDFNPILKGADFESLQKGIIPEDIKKEQEYIKWADIISFVYPIWWTGMPAILKGYIDRVFSYGFAYEYNNQKPVGLLKDKKVMVFNTTGTASHLYADMGMHTAIKQTSDMGIFSFSGMEVLSHTFFGSVPQVDDETRQGYLKDVQEIINIHLQEYSLK